MKANKLTALLFGSILAAPLASQANDNQIDNALIIVNSGSLQTQGMAMVLGNAMQDKGTHVDVLLCDKAGDLALNATNNKQLKPKKGGASVNVCALYLPNSSHSKDALREGVGVAAPPEIAQQMTAKNTRVFSF
jgi:hypothetical protein